ncbi:transcriptional regulator [Streptomyces californicus]|uniref:transcriptional regulator n=1 Tax=Streptomyces californicus TaxID=67351 RepID=UPI003715A35B
MPTPTPPPAKALLAAPDGEQFVPEAAQWIAHTTGRLAPDAYAWMQAVHWFHDHGPRLRGRAHGPKRIGRTTMRLAVVLARLKECRPGVDTLTAWLNVSERTIQYHLGLLREAGLLTYLTKGTRISGIGGRASEFARTVPSSFDDALGLRTGPSTDYIRAVHGIAEPHRALMARLGKKARRSLKQNPTKRSNRSPGPPASAPSSCTPRGVSTSTSSSTGDTSLPPESKLGTGKHKSPSPKKSTPRRQRLNAVGRRHQLAHQLVQQLPWLHRAAVPRIAWIVRHVADAGWTAAEVVAVISQQAPPRHVSRPSGFLAARLNGAHLLYDTEAKRQNIVDWWRESRRAARDRHADWSGEWQAPASRSLARQVDEVFAQMRATAHEGPAVAAFEGGDDGMADLDQLTRDEIVDLRAAALKDPGLIRTTIAECGEPYARRLFTHHVVDQLQRLRGTARLVLHTQWRHA